MPSQQAPNTDFQRVGNYLRASWALTDGSSHAAAITNTVASDYADVKFHRLITITINNASGTTTATVQGSIDAVDWYTIAYRADASATYTLTAVSQVGAGLKSLELNPDSCWRYIRLNVSAAGSATCKLYCESR